MAVAGKRAEPVASTTALEGEKSIRIRMSVGLEDCTDIERDLEQAIG